MTPNKSYRQNKQTGLSFKKWLQIEKSKGNFLTEDDTATENKSNFINILGENINEEIVELPANNSYYPFTKRVLNNNIIGVVSLSFLVYGIYQIRKNKIEESND